MWITNQVNYMTRYDTNSNKTGGIDAKPATVITTGGREIDANHHIINDTARVCHVYLGARSDGIDVSIPLARVTAIVRSERGADALGVDNVGSDGEGDRENRLVADGGETATCPDCDKGTEWVAHPDKAAIQALCGGCAADRAVDAAMRDVHPDNDVWGGSKPSDDDRLVTDGGREQMRIVDFDGEDTYEGPGVENIAVGDKVIKRFNGAKYDPWTVESFDDERAEIRRGDYSMSISRDWLGEYVPRPDTPKQTYASEGECKMDGCDNLLENREMPVQGYCGPVHAQRDQYDGDFALDTADVAGFSGVQR